MEKNNRKNLEHLKSENDIRLDKIEHEIAYSGELIINRSEDLGINDPLTHLFLYINHGEEALVGIKQDIETDIAERLPKTPFVNYVGFELQDDDFLSIKDRISMRKMATANLDILSNELKNNISLQQEYNRAIIESEEVNKLNNWFKSAPLNSFLIFESLPIGNQEIAISRIYKKVSSSYLEGCFVSLYNPSIVQFNEFREKISNNQSYYKDELDILSNNYSFFDPDIESSSDFIDYYVGIYDKIFDDRRGIKTSFGLDIDIDIEKQNGIEKVRQHPKLTSIYIDTIRSMSTGKATVTPDLMTICNRLHVDNYLTLNDRITTDSARGLLKNVILGIAGVIDKGDSQLLIDLANCNTESAVFYDTVSHYSDVANRSSNSYSSLGCPEISRSESQLNSDDQDSEYTSMLRAFGVYEKLDNFGKAKIDVCIIKNCPSHGKGIFPEKTLVGGCGICPHCHKILQIGGSPEDIYSKEDKEKERQVQINKINITRQLIKKLDEKEQEKRHNLIKQARKMKNLEKKDTLLEKQIEKDDYDIKKLKLNIKDVA